MKMEETLRIVSDRLGAVIGPNGNAKKKIEQLTKTRISVDSAEQTVTVTFSGKGDPMGFYSALAMVKAIGRGFSPENALWLADPDYQLHIVNISDFTGGSEKQIANKRSRLIGTSGKVRKQLEERTDTKISVYGKTVALIGKPSDLEDAKDAVERILSGAQFETVWRHLARGRVEKNEWE